MGQTLNPAQLLRAELRMRSKIRRHETLVATIAERSGWNVGTSKGINPETLALVGAADDPIDTVLAERVALSPDGRNVIHATFVLRDDSYSARRRKGVDTRKGVALTDGKHGACYRVNPDGTRVAINRNGSIKGGNHGNAKGLLD